MSRSQVPANVKAEIARMIFTGVGRKRTLEWIKGLDTDTVTPITDIGRETQGWLFQNFGHFNMAKQFIKNCRPNRDPEAERTRKAKYGKPSVTMDQPVSPVRKALMAAREIITSPDSWTTATMARDALGRSVYPLDAAACKFCALGAIAKATGTNDVHEETAGTPDVTIRAIHTLASAIGPRPAGALALTRVYRFNDNLSNGGQAAVLAAFDKAIAMA